MSISTSPSSAAARNPQWSPSSNEGVPFLAPAPPRLARHASSSRGAGAGLTGLPADVLLHVANFLEPSDLLSLCLTQRGLQATLDESPAWAPDELARLERAAHGQRGSSGGGGIANARQHFLAALRRRELASGVGAKIRARAPLDARSLWFRILADTAHFLVMPALHACLPLTLLLVGLITLPRAETAARLAATTGFAALLRPAALMGFVRFLCWLAVALAVEAALLLAGFTTLALALATSSGGGGSCTPAQLTADAIPAHLARAFGAVFRRAPCARRYSIPSATGRAAGGAVGFLQRALTFGGAGTIAAGPPGWERLELGLNYGLSIGSIFSVMERTLPLWPRPLYGSPAAGKPPAPPRGSAGAGGQTTGAAAATASAAGESMRRAVLNTGSVTRSSLLIVAFIVLVGPILAVWGWMEVRAAAAAAVAAAAAAASPAVPALLGGGSGDDAAFDAAAASSSALLKPLAALLLVVAAAALLPRMRASSWAGVASTSCGALALALHAAENDRLRIVRAQALAATAAAAGASSSASSSAAATAPVAADETAAAAWQMLGAAVRGRQTMTVATQGVERTGAAGSNSGQLMPYTFMGTGFELHAGLSPAPTAPLAAGADPAQVAAGRDATAANRLETSDAPDRAVARYGRLGAEPPVDRSRWSIDLRGPLRTVLAVRAQLIQHGSLQCSERMLRSRGLLWCVLWLPLLAVTIFSLRSDWLVRPALLATASPQAITPLLLSDVVPVARFDPLLHASKTSSNSSDGSTGNAEFEPHTLQGGSSSAADLELTGLSRLYRAEAALLGQLAACSAAADAMRLELSLWRRNDHDEPALPALRLQLAAARAHLVQMAASTSADPETQVAIVFPPSTADLPASAMPRALVPSPRAHGKPVIVAPWRGLAALSSPGTLALHLRDRDVIGRSQLSNWMETPQQAVMAAGYAGMLRAGAMAYENASCAAVMAAIPNHADATAADASTAAPSAYSAWAALTCSSCKGVAAEKGWPALVNCVAMADAAAAAPSHRWLTVAELIRLVHGAPAPTPAAAAVNSTDSGAAAAAAAGTNAASSSTLDHMGAAGSASESLFAAMEGAKATAAVSAAELRISVEPEQLCPTFLWTVWRVARLLLIALTCLIIIAIAVYGGSSVGNIGSGWSSSSRRTGRAGDGSAPASATGGAGAGEDAENAAAEDGGGFFASCWRGVLWVWSFLVCALNPIPVLRWVASFGIIATIGTVIGLIFVAVRAARATRALPPNPRGLITLAAPVGVLVFIRFVTVCAHTFLAVACQTPFMFEGPASMVTAKPPHIVPLAAALSASSASTTSATAASAAGESVFGAPARPGGAEGVVGDGSMTLAQLLGSLLSFCLSSLNPAPIFKGIFSMRWLFWLCVIGTVVACVCFVVSETRRGRDAWFINLAVSAFFAAAGWTFFAVVTRVVSYAPRTAWSNRRLLWQGMLAVGGGFDYALTRWLTAALPLCIWYAVQGRAAERVQDAHADPRAVTSMTQLAAAQIANPLPAHAGDGSDGRGIMRNGGAGAAADVGATPLRHRSHRAASGSGGSTSSGGSTNSDPRPHAPAAALCVIPAWVDAEAAPATPLPARPPLHHYVMHAGRWALPISLFLLAARADSGPAAKLLWYVPAPIFAAPSLAFFAGVALLGVACVAAGVHQSVHFLPQRNLRRVPGLPRGLVAWFWSMPDGAPAGETPVWHASVPRDMSIDLLAPLSN